MMRIRLPLLILGALVGASACSPDHKSKRPRGPLHTPSLGEKTAARFGVTIASSDKHGTPRLVRAIVPRKAAQGATPDQAAREHLATLAPLWMSGGQQADLISGGVQKLQGGSAVVTLRQRVNQIDVHQGDVRVMLHSDGQLSAISGTLLSSSENEGRDSFRMTARDALNRALDEVYGQTRARPGISNIETKEGYQHLAVVATPEFHVQQARAKAEWLAQDGELIPAWVVEVISDKKGKIAAWRFLVSDADGQLLRKIDLIHKDGFLYRVFAESTGNRRPFDGPMQSFTPHPTGMPDGSLPGLVSSNLVAMDSFNANRDPWLPSDATNATGNNVEAFADIRPPVGFSEGDIRAEVRSGRILNYLYDLTQEPLQNPNQSKAAITNAFFVTNWLHDWYYDSGFTEKTGNAQADNYGRGGIGGDRLVVHVQAGATDGARDNAYITTPLDGLSPQLFLFLYGSAVQADVTWLGGTLKAEYFTLGPRNFEITGALSLVDDGVEKAGDGCEPIVNDVKGRIAIVDFDERCASELPLENALKAGALGVIFVMEQTFRLQGGNQEIPGLMIAKADSEGLINALAHGAVRATLRRSSSSPERDTALDNTIVAHEWGHYLHTRLTSCEDYQCRAMSEGWGDFVALHMMLRDEDDRMGTFALNTYAMSGQGMVQEGYQDPGYFGIRRFPYSIDRQKNALSFRHIEDGNPLPEGPVNSGANAYQNSEIHNAGEVWATMLWEAYHALIDAHGVEDSRRRMTDYVVAGLLLTPPNATYTEGRDAILAATAAIDRDDMLLIAAAFAARGAGTCAVSPLRDFKRPRGVVESTTVSGRLEASDPTLRVDGTSCDKDSYLDPGESGTLRVTLVNSGVLSVEGITVTPTTTTPGITFGKPFQLPALAAFGTAEVEIPVVASASMPVGELLRIAIEVTGDAGCATNALQLVLEQRIGQDEAPNASRTDDVEAEITPWTVTGVDAEKRWSRVGNQVGKHSWFGRDAIVAGDTQLVSPVLNASANEALIVTVSHRFDFKTKVYPPKLDGSENLDFMDGGLIELSTDDGASWSDGLQLGATTQYTGDLKSGTDNPIAGRKTYARRNPSFPNRDEVTLNFGTQFAGKAVRLRFRIGTDSTKDAASPGTGWDIDDIRVSGIDNTPFPAIVPETSICTGLEVAQTRANVTVHKAPKRTPGSNTLR